MHYLDGDGVDDLDYMGLVSEMGTFELDDADLFGDLNADGRANVLVNLIIG